MARKLIIAVFSFLAIVALLCPPAQTAEEPQHAAHGSAAEGGHGPSSPIEFKADLAIYTLIVFGILVFVLSKIAWKPMLEAAQARETAITQAVEQAEKARAEAEALLNEHRQRLAKADEEVRQILDRARNEAEKLREELLAKARAETDEIKRQAQEEIERARDEALREFFERAADLVVEATGRILPGLLSADQHRQLAARVLEEISTESTKHTG